MSNQKRKLAMRILATTVLLTLAVLIMGGCGIRSEPTDDPADENTLRTQAASTMAVIEESIFTGLTATSLADEGTFRTQTAVVEELIHSATQTAEAQIPTGTQPALWITPLPVGSPIVQLPTSWGYPQPGSCNRAQFLGDVTYGDYAQVMPGSVIVKTWRIRNTGTCVWNSSYRIIDQKNGADMGSLTTAGLPPGGVVDISVTFTVPSVEGLFVGNYLFMAGDGAFFGVGTDGLTPVWFRVVVGQPQEIPGAQDRTRIQFPTGAISTSLNGRVTANGMNAYVLRARQGQTMTVTVVSTGDHAVLTIYGLTDGMPLVRGNASGATSWQGILPLTQDYALDVISDGTPADYGLQITIQ